MNFLTYKLKFPNLPNSSSVSVNYTTPTYIGSTNLDIILTETDSTISKLRKLVFSFSDAPDDLVILQVSLFGNDTLENKSISHVFPSTENSLTTYTISVTGFRNDLTYGTDFFSINVPIKQSSISHYGALSIMKTAIFDNKESLDNMLVIGETNSLRQLVTFVIPNNLETTT